MRTFQALRANLSLENGDLVLTSPFDRGLVDEIKELPYNDRTWDASRKVWRIKYMHGSTVAKLVKKHLGQEIQVPAQQTYSDSYIQTRLFKIEYVGATKTREDGSQTATGFTAGTWSVIFPQTVLMAWFGGQESPSEAPTLFGVLGIKKDASPEEIKKAYRLAARTWHPDVNKEPNAAEQFRRIQEAWEILRDDQLKRKYLAGLKFERDAKKYSDSRPSDFGWCPPIRCGFVTVECTESVGRFFVTKILAWGEIQDSSGKIMVSYWPKGQDQFKVEFI